MINNYSKMYLQVHNILLGFRTIQIKTPKDEVIYAMHFNYKTKTQIY